MNFLKLLSIITLLAVMQGCNFTEEHKTEQKKLLKKEENKSIDRKISDEFKAYWYNGKAEVTSYKLLQERYGEIRKGTAVNVFVTEEFLKKEQVKANNSSENNISVLKLNQTKSFNTGIYPYSIMTSTFSPITEREHALKVTNSVQEWCGQVYMQLNNRNKFEVESHSYFEGEGDQKFSLSKTWLENEIWNLIRINPEELPTGEITIIPSLEYLRLRHKEIKAYNASASIKQGDSISIYTINYPELQRQLRLFFHSKFPNEIEKWEEINAANKSDTSRLKTTATKIKRIQSSYWNENRNEFNHLRDSLGLK